MSRHIDVSFAGSAHALCGQRRLYSIRRTHLSLSCWLALLSCARAPLLFFEVFCMCSALKRLRRIPWLLPKAVGKQRHKFRLRMMASRARGGRSLTCVVLCSFACTCPLWLKALQGELRLYSAFVAGLMTSNIPCRRRSVQE